nr:MAG TPA: hypothetical protein [Bacteriophage sp.]
MCVTCPGFPVICRSCPGYISIIVVWRCICHFKAFYNRSQ